MNRREFLAAGAAAALLQRVDAEVTVEVVHSRNSYAALLKDIEPGHDEFPIEREAFETAAHLKRMPETRVLPWSADLTGSSPCAASYEPVAEGVMRARYDASDSNVMSGLQKWLDSLGNIRAARFYVLPEDEVRYEIATDGQYRVGRWRQKWIAGRIAHFSPIEETVTVSPAPLFRDITAWAFGESESFRQQLSKGIPYWRAHLDAASGIDVHGHNGIAVGDIDGDGFDEIYVCQPGGLSNRLYKNRGDGTFEDITEHAGVGVLDPTSSALFADFRNTGRQDLVVLRPDGPLLFLNRGGNRFEFRAGAFRFRTAAQGSFTGMAAADYDRDGRLDLYLCTYSFFRDTTQYRYPSPYQDARNGPPNFLFRNQLTDDGDGIFLDVTEAVGLNHNNDRFSFAPAWCDYNGDGWPDLFVANDFGRKNLYRNEGGKFRDVAAEAGVEDTGDGMSASWFDYDGDGRPDLYVSNMWSDAGQRIVAQKEFKPAHRSDAPSEASVWRRHAKGNSLYRNRGDGTFEETGAVEGVEMGRWAWGSDGIDFDNDGVPEIFITTGMLTNSSETDLESFFWRKVAAASPVSAKPDLGYENGWNALSQAVHQEFSEAGRQPNVFYVRRGGRYYDFSGVSGLDFADDSRAFAVTDLDGDGNLDLLLKSRLGPQVRVFRNDSAEGRTAIAFRLRGVKSNRDGIGARVEVDGKVKFVQAGSGYLSQHTKVLHFGLGAARTAQTVRLLWPSGVRQEFGGLAAGFLHEIDEDSGEVRHKPFSLRREIPGGGLTGDNGIQFGDTWLLEPAVLPEPVSGPGFIRLSALSAERAAWYGLFCRYLFDLRADLKLPVWFLVDETGKAHKIYFSPPDPDDMKLLKGAARESLALPYPGRFFTPPERNYSSLGAAFFAAGFPDQALRYLLLAPQQDVRNLFAIAQIHLVAGRWEPARKYYEKGLALTPDSADGWNNLGAVEMGAANYAAALNRYQKALALRPDMTSALINAGEAHLAMGDQGEAEKMFARAIEIKPDDPAAANQMGELFVRQGRDGEAKSWFQRALSGERDYAPAINNLGSLYMRAGQPNDAIAAFRYGITVVPDEESFYLNLGSIFMAIGEPENARDTVTRLLVRNPGSARAKQLLRQWETR